MVRLRFNLGRGDNYKKWQFKKYEGKEMLIKEHYDPNKVGILLRDATLKNQKAKAEKIFNGANKTVCAWVDAEEAKFYHPNYASWFDLEIAQSVRYNPREAPNWINSDGDNLDGKTIKFIMSVGNRLYDVSDQIKTIEVKL